MVQRSVVSNGEGPGTLGNQQFHQRTSLLYCIIVYKHCEPVIDEGRIGTAIPGMCSLFHHETNGTTTTCDKNSHVKEEVTILTCERSFSFFIPTATIIAIERTDLPQRSSSDQYMVLLQLILRQ